jgi:hypothetical protein
MAVDCELHTPAALPTEEDPFGIHCIVCEVDLRVSIETVEKRKLTSHYRECNSELPCA